MSLRGVGAAEPAQLLGVRDHALRGNHHLPNQPILPFPRTLRASTLDFLRPVAGRELGKDGPDYCQTAPNPVEYLALFGSPAADLLHQTRQRLVSSAPLDLTALLSLLRVLVSEEIELEHALDNSVRQVCHRLGLAYARESCAKGQADEECGEDGQKGDEM